MYKKILVPLDKSDLDECVFSHLQAFIHGFNITDVIFVHVEPPEKSHHGEYYIDPKTKKEYETVRVSSAKRYLDQVVNRLKSEGATLHTEVIIGKVTESIINYIEKNDIDLIIIATHARSGVTQLIRGSEAYKIFSYATVPVLMIRGPGIQG
jgi:nucleotide-binding universal stress UspA family protein